ncbi:MAG: serine/threonine protein kinase [Moraxellaceae bacterium]|nr:serine/threonine protein kinase [Moraxellaceae bacterium]
MMIQSIGKYHIDGIIGHGAMGIVYKGFDSSINRTVAIKTIHHHLLLGDSGAELLKRFKAEATAAARCQHQNIIAIYDFGQQEDNTPYIVMEFVNGHTLENLLKTQQKLSFEQINRLFLSICDGLNYAHQQGIIHRDIKPANIIVLDDDRIKIADFGIAKIESSDSTQLGMSLGTPSYMAPEQSLGQVIDARVDIFALGIIAFELFNSCHDLPTALCQYSIMTDIDIAKRKKLNPQTLLPKLLVDFIDTCLQANVDNRYKNMSDLIAHYQAIIQQIKSVSQLDIDNNLNSTQDLPNASLLQEESLNFDLHPDFCDMVSDAKPQAQNTVDHFAETKITTKPTELPSAPKLEIQEQVKKALTVLDIIRLLKDIHPVFSRDWQDKIPNLLDKLDEDSRRRVYKTILEPKNIIATPDNKLVFSGRLTLADAKKVLMSRPISSALDKLLRIVSNIKQTRNIITIADSLEAGIELINNINAEDNFALQKEKLRLAEVFLYDFAIELREHDFDPPPSERGLTVDMIKTYIIEVFIKEKVLSYWFSTTPVRELQQDPLLFVKTTLFNEAKVRRLGVVSTERYFFFIGEVAKFEQDPYSVRRFLLDDNVMGGRFIYFNILAVDKHKIHEPTYQTKVQKDLTRVVTLQRQLTNQVIEFVDSLENCQITYLLPLLTKPLEADGTNLQTLIEFRLRDYERNLSLLALGKANRVLKEFAQTPDDYEYLFFGLKSFLIELLSDIRDFYYQSSARWSIKSQEMEFKLVCYLRLLEKRKNSIFTADSEYIINENPELDFNQPVNELKKIIDDAAPKIRIVKQKIKDAYQEIELASKRSDWQKFWDKCLNKKLPDPEIFRKRLEQTSKETLVSIVRIPKKYKRTTIYLEFEGLIGIDENVRHYAFPKGDNGISLLPILVRLPEDSRDFDVASVKEALKPTIFSQFGATIS